MASKSVSVVTSTFSPVTNCDFCNPVWRASLARSPDRGVAGFYATRKIRMLVRRNMRELERHGVCVTVTQTSGSHDRRPSQAYMLNLVQAMVVCTLSRTRKGMDVRAVVIR
jgi:hypothetical protein